MQQPSVTDPATTQALNHTGAEKPDMEALDKLEKAMENMCKLDHRIAKGGSDTLLRVREFMQGKIDDMRTNQARSASPVGRLCPHTEEEDHTTPRANASPIKMRRRKVSFGEQPKDKKTTTPSPTAERPSPTILPKSDDDEEFIKNSLESISTAEALLEAKEKRELEKQEEWDKLPLLMAGKTYKKDEVSNGFRVLDGYTVSYNQDGDVNVGSDRDPTHEKEVTRTMIPSWTDGGFAWMYWSNSLKNKQGKSLNECVIRHGMGGWTDTERNLRCKVVYLDEGRSFQPGRCFVIAMDRPSDKSEVLVKGNELNEEVVRIYRASVPDDVQKIITLRELINVRQGLDAPGWWFM